MPEQQPPTPNPQQMPPTPGWLDGPKQALGRFLQWWNKPFSTRTTGDKALRVFTGVVGILLGLGLLAVGVYSLFWLAPAALAGVSAGLAMTVGLSIIFGIALIVHAAQKGWLSLAGEFVKNVWNSWTRPQEEAELDAADEARKQAQSAANPLNPPKPDDQVKSGSGVTLEHQTNPTYRAEVTPLEGSTVARVQDVYNMLAKDTPDATEYKPQYSRPIPHDDNSVILNFPGVAAREAFFEQLRTDGIAFTAYDREGNIVAEFSEEQARVRAEQMPAADDVHAPADDADASEHDVPSGFGVEDSDCGSADDGDRDTHQARHGTGP